MSQSQSDSEIRPLGTEPEPVGVAPAEAPDDEVDDEVDDDDTDDLDDLDDLDDDLEDDDPWYDYGIGDDDDDDDDDDEEEPMAELQEHPLTFFTSTRKEFASNASRRFISHEIEVAGCNASRAYLIDEACYAQKNSVVEDGSLPGGGFEINTAPANGDAYLGRMRALCDALGRASASVTHACGAHVHVSADDFDFWDVRRLVRLYAHVEQALFDMVSDSRTSNYYCQRCGAGLLSGLGKSARPKQAFAKTLYSTTCHKKLRRIKREKSNDVRYHALNLHSWYYRGTVECRLHQGTVSYEKLTNWGMLWAALLDRVARTSDSAMDRLIASGTGAEVLLEVAPTDGVRDYIRERTLHFGRTLTPGLYRTPAAV